MADAPAAANPFEPPKAALEREVDGVAAPPLWNPNAAGLWSVFLSPVFGSVLVRKNWEALDEPAKVRAGALWIIASIFFAIVSVFIGVAAFIYLVVWYFAWQKPQATYIRERWGPVYPRRGWSVPVLVAIGVWVVVTVCIYVLGVAIFSVAS